MSAYESVIDALAELGRVHRSGKRRATTQCPAHEDRNPSLSVRHVQDRVLIHCHAGCDTRDVLASLDLAMADLFDEKGKRSWKPDPEAQARYGARRTMTPLEKQLDDLLQLPDLGERLCLAIARIRPELYIWEREQLADEVDVALHPQYLPFIDWLTGEFSPPATERWAA